jgi:peroxiredoxin
MYLVNPFIKSNVRRNYFLHEGSYKLNNFHPNESLYTRDLILTPDNRFFFKNLNMRMVRLFIILLGVSGLLACDSSARKELQPGVWRATLARDGQQLPFLFEISKNADRKTYNVVSMNGEERIRFDSAYFENDSIHIPMELFDSEIVAFVDGNSLNGRYNRKHGDRVIASLPFEARLGEKYRFFKEGEAQSTHSVAGKWSVSLVNPLTGDSTPAVGVFQQNGVVVEGTFLTRTGDYRYLSGSLNGDSLYLSNFDGDNAKLFKAVIGKDGTLSGSLWSGVKSYRTWQGKREPAAKLPDPTSLTYLKPGFETVSFSLPDAEGNTVSLTDDRFKDKVVIIQILGTWCPNCMDETLFLAPWIKRNRSRGVEVVGLAFEHSEKPEISIPKIKRMSARYGVDYPILLAGTNTNEATAKALPMINKIMSYPTSIIIDRKGKVRQIHTGFSGPGTGEYYEQFVEDFNGLMDKLISEK